jgi:hypothetical protein
MDDARRRELIQVYRDGIFNDTLPFWQKHTHVEKHGGTASPADFNSLLSRRVSGLCIAPDVTPCPAAAHLQPLFLLRWHSSTLETI